jgi:hypothetical protein
MTGTNIGTGNFVDPLVLRDRGYRLVRLVSLASTEDYAARCRAAGIAVLAVVIPAQSGGYVMGNADVYQFDNERDLGQSAADYQAEATFYQRTYPDLTWISCGMASGQPAWWKAVQAAGGLPGYSGYAVHPYNKTPDQAASLLDQYKRITPNLDLWVTEWARPAAEIPRFQFMLRSRAVHDLYFCEDCGVPGFQAPPLIIARS